MATLGSLVVTLEANIAKFQSDLGKAATIAEAQMNRIAKTLAGVQNGFNMLAGGFGMYQLGAFGLDVIKATSRLQELSTATGLTVPALSALSVEAQRAGMTVDDAAMSFDRMQRNAALALGGNRTAAANFAAVGLSAKQLADGLKDPQKLLLDVAKAMEKFADDGNKTTIMMALFGKAGAAQIELLHSLAAEGYAAANVTAEQARRAKEFEVAMTNLSVRIKSFALDLMTDFIPALDWVGNSAVASMDKAWIMVRYEFKQMLITMKDDLSSFANGVEGFAKKVAGFFGISFKEVNHDWDESLGENINAMVMKRTAELAAVDKQLRDTTLGTNSLDAIEVTAKKILPSVPIPHKPPKEPTQVHDVLAAQMAQRLKIIADAMKTEDALTKLANKQLDDNYTHGTTSLAQYSVDKQNLLRKNAALVQSLYASEIALVRSYVDRYSADIDRLEKKERAHAITTTELAKLATERKEKEAALAKMGELGTAATDAGIEADVKKIALNDKLLADQENLARTILDTAMAYEVMNGDTEKANALQTVLAQRAARVTLEANGQVETLKQLDAIAERNRMNASKDPFDGMTRAMIAYKNGLTDVAKATESMTTKMLTGMEDAIVSFVQTGKLSWRSLVDSMIADLIRMQVRSQVMPWISQAFGLAMTAMGGAGAGVDTNASATLVGPPQALGGPVNLGQQYTVGERGPEQFVPSVQGSIVPNGGGGGQGITYAPTIQIDSRSDRAQVQADTAAQLRQSNKELLGLLQRYNQGLRA